MRKNMNEMSPEQRRSRPKWPRLLLVVVIAILQVAALAAPAGAQEVPIRDYDEPDGPFCQRITGLPEEIEAEICYTKARLHDSSTDWDEWLYHTELRVAVEHHGACTYLRCPQVRLRDIAIGHEPTQATKERFIGGGVQPLRWTPWSNGTNTCSQYVTPISDVLNGFRLFGFEESDCETTYSSKNYQTGHVVSKVVGQNGCSSFSMACISPGQKELVAYSTSIIRTQQRPNNSWRPYFDDYFRIRVRNSFPGGKAIFGNNYM